MNTPHHSYLDNTATVTAVDPSAAFVVDISDSANPADVGSVDATGHPVVDVDGNPVDDGNADNDPIRLVIDPVGDIGLTKSGQYRDLTGDGLVNAGDAIDFSFAVTNTGNVTLTDITIDDPLVTVTGGPIASLAPGQTDATTFTATLIVTAADIDAGQIVNSATAMGTTPDGNPVADVSDDPTDPTDDDPDGDSNPDDPTVVALNPDPGLTLVKTAVPAPIAGAGDTITWSLTVTNTGNVTLTDITIDDPLIDGTGPVCDAAGTPELALLAPADSATCAVDYVVTQADVDAGGVENSAVAVGTPPSGGPVDDVSDSGGATPPGNDGSGTDDPTWVAIDEAPALTLTKAVRHVNSLGDGTFAIGYQLTVDNTGNVTVAQLQIDDDLGVTFPSPTIATVTDVQVAAGDCQPNPGYDGTTDTDLLTGNDSHAVGETCVIFLDVVVVPNGVTAWENAAVAYATTPAGTSTADDSDAGDESIETPGLDGGTDSDPTNDPTLVDITEAPSIGIAKDLSEGPADLGDGSFGLVFDLTVVNTGDVPLDAVQIIEDLASAYQGSSFTVTSVTATGGPCTPNPTFNGSSDQRVLSGTDTLAVAEMCQVTVASVVTPTMRFAGENQVSANGASPLGTVVVDLSTTGTLVDPDDDGQPTEEEPNSFVLGPPAMPDVDLDNPHGTVVAVEPVTNDGDGIPLDESSVEIWDPTTSTYVTSLTVAGEGAWQVDPATGVVTFTPEPGVTTNPTPVTYRVGVSGTDVSISSTITITYEQPAVRRTDPPACTGWTCVVSPSGRPPTVAPSPTSVDAPEPGRGVALAHTGTETAALAAVGFSLMFGGAALLLAARRQRLAGLTG